MTETSKSELADGGRAQAGSEGSDDRVLRIDDIYPEVVSSQERLL